MESAVGRTALGSLKAEAARLKEANERLEQQNRQMEREIQRLKAAGAQAQARNVPGKKIASFHCYWARFDEPMDAAALRSSADAIRKTDPEAVIFLTDSQGFCVATSGEAAVKQGIQADQMMDLARQVAGGSGGGRPQMAQGRIQKPASFFDIQVQLEQYVQERSK